MWVSKVVVLCCDDGGEEARSGSGKKRQSYTHKFFQFFVLRQLSCIISITTFIGASQPRTCHPARTAVSPWHEFSTTPMPLSSLGFVKKGTLSKYLRHWAYKSGCPVCPDDQGLFIGPIRVHENPPHPQAHLGADLGTSRDGRQDPSPVARNRIHLSCRAAVAKRQSVRP